ncbi:MAG: OmpA family protein [candidate division WOR-3 bacterium]|nr:MAG: OmpA family protein [candidate division WOR-3 bacterium]
MRVALYIIVLFSSLGCQKGLEFYTIHFEEFTTEIVLEDSSLLYRNLETLEDNPRIEIELAGHTNSVGPASENVILSQARADTIRLWLMRNEIDSLRLTSVGYGETIPIADNRTAEGRAKNDRVEFVEK